MRYHFRKPDIYASRCAQAYACDHPLYNRCTLYKIGERGLAVIQQRFDEKDKRSWWGEIDPWLTDAIYIQEGFKAFFDSRADKADAGGLYPTVTVRQIMWALRMKPLARARWETVFDRRLV